MFRIINLQKPITGTDRRFLLIPGAKRINLFLVLLLFPLLCYSQFTLKGRVTDGENPIPYGNVILADQVGNMVNGTVTDEEGNFEIEAAAGTYTLKVTYLGYKTHEEEVVLDLDKVLPPVLLTEEASQLGEVIVSADRPIVTKKVDRLVFNLDGSINATGGNALDALRISPRIVVGSDGQLTMIGKSGMRVMVDGRIIPLTGQELSDFLSGISADDIKEIEIITNPPAKYEAQGNSGLINIVFKKGKNNSWNNTSVLSYTQAKLGAYGFSNNFNYKKNKVSMLVSLSGDAGDRHVIHEGEALYSTGPWRFTIDQESRQDNLSGNLLLDYELGERSTIGMQYLGAVSNPDVKDNTTTRIYNNEGGIDSLLLNDRLNDREISYHSLNTHYSLDFDTLGRRMTIDLDYFNYVSGESINVATDNVLPDETYLRTSFSDLTYLDQSLNNFNARLDIEHPFKAVNLSYGANISFTDNLYRIQNYNTLSEVREFNPLRSDDFEYSENKQALYVNGSKNFSKKWEAQVGLRVENTQAIGVSNRLKETNRFNYVELFPTFYLTYNLNQSNSFSLNYGRRINRPSFGQLNPARSYINSNTYSVGNPFLQPSFTDNLELTHTFMGNLVTQLFVSYESDGFGSLYSADNETNEQAVIKANYFNRYDYGLTQFYTFDKVSWWESQNSLYLLNSSSTIYNPEVNAVIKNSWRTYFATKNTFNLNKAKTIRSQVNFWYSSAFENNIYEYGEGYSLDLALQFRLLEKRLQTSMGVYDVFSTSPLSRTTTVNDIRQMHTVYPSNRHLRMSMVYKFGSKNINIRRRNLGNEEEQNRAN